MKREEQVSPVVSVLIGFAVALVLVFALIGRLRGVIDLLRGVQ